MSKKKLPEERISAIAPFGLRMSESLRERIAQAAAAGGRSMNTEIVARLERSFSPITIDRETYESFKTFHEHLKLIIDNPKLQEAYQEAGLIDKDDKGGISWK